VSVEKEYVTHLNTGLLPNCYCDLCFTERSQHWSWTHLKTHEKNLVLYFVF